MFWLLLATDALESLLQDIGTDVSVVLRFKAEFIKCEEDKCLKAKGSGLPECQALEAKKAQRNLLSLAVQNQSQSLSQSVNQRGKDL